VTTPSSLGQPNSIAIVAFVTFALITLAITFWAARRTKTREDFFAAGGNVSAVQNGFALAGDYMSAASFLGIAGLVSMSGLIYSVGWLVGWPILTFLIAEPLRNLGQYTFADVVAFRLKQRPVRIAASAGALTVIAFYLIAQMVGAGNLIHLMFGLQYRSAVIVVGAVMLAYVLFGGMIATTWVQIIKAVLLLVGATGLAVLVLAKFGGSPLALFDAAQAKYGAEVLAPGKLVADPIEAVSLGIALIFGTAGLPHILMRFYTVPDARTARTSLLWATSLIGFFYLVTFILGFGAAVLVGREAIASADKGGNMAALLLADVLGGSGFLGIIAAVAFATILAVVAGLTLSGSAAIAHDLFGHVIKRGHAKPADVLRVARLATIGLAVLAIAMGLAFEGQNVAFMVGLAFSIAASANFPTLVLSVMWRGLSTWGAVSSIVVGITSSVLLIVLSPTVWQQLLGNPEAIISLKNPGIIAVPLSFATAIIGSKLWPDANRDDMFDRARRRMLLGPRAATTAAVPTK
jgi:cation/acetate symporter